MVILQIISDISLPPLAEDPERFYQAGNKRKQ